MVSSSDFLSFCFCMFFLQQKFAHPITSDPTTNTPEDPQRKGLSMVCIFPSTQPSDMEGMGEGH